MDILYIVGTGSKHDNIELRMSLRSICKYGKNVGRVIVAGYPPDFLSDEVVKVPVANKYHRKHHNLVYCIQQVVDSGYLRGDFLYSSDDHFYVKTVDFDNYPIFFKRTELRNHATPGERHYGYHLSLKETRETLEKFHMPIVNFEQHCNTHMNAEVIRDSHEIIEASYKTERGCAPTTLFMNAWMSRADGPRTFSKRSDIKMRAASSVREIRERIGDAECFSIGDAAFSTNALMDFFKEEFPSPCKYEKEGVA